MAIETSWYPSCCKAIIINNFYRDDNGSWIGGSYVKLSKEDIINNTRRELEDIFNGPTFEYEEMVVIAAVSEGQLITKEILEKEYGFVVFNEADNPDSDDGHVYMMHRLVITDVQVEEEDDDWREDDYDDYEED